MVELYVQRKGNVKFDQYLVKRNFGHLSQVATQELYVQQLQNSSSMSLSCTIEFMFILGYHWMYKVAIDEHYVLNV